MDCQTIAGALRGVPLALARHRLAQIAQIARDVFEWKIGDRAVVARRTQENANAFATSNQLSRDMTAKKTRGTGDERRHIQSPTSYAPSPVAETFCGTGIPAVAA